MNIHSVKANRYKYCTQTPVPASYTCAHYNTTENRNFDAANLSLASHITSEPGERDNLFLSHHILQVSNSTSQMHMLDSISCFTSVFEVNPQVGALCLGSYKGRKRWLSWLQSSEQHKQPTSLSIQRNDLKLHEDGVVELTKLFVTCLKQILILRQTEL